MGPRLTPTSYRYEVARNSSWRIRPSQQVLGGLASGRTLDRCIRPRIKTAVEVSRGARGGRLRPAYRRVSTLDIEEHLAKDGRAILWTSVANKSLPPANRYG